MKNNQDSPYTYFPTLVRFGQDVLSCSVVEIKEFFPSNKHFLIDSKDDKWCKQMLEVELEHATISCIINEEGKCTFSFIFLGEFSNVEHYIRYCDKEFTYDADLKVWLTPKGYLKLKYSEIKQDLMFIQYLTLEEGMYF